MSNWVKRVFGVDWYCTGKPGHRIDYALHQDGVWSIHIVAIELAPKLWGGPDTGQFSIQWTVYKRGTSINFEREKVARGRRVKRQRGTLSAAMCTGLNALRKAQSA